MSILNCMKVSDMKKAIPGEKKDKEKEEKKEDSEKK